jgi:Fe(3+) dicitrate transport protein
MHRRFSPYVVASTLALSVATRARAQATDEPKTKEPKSTEITVVGSTEAETGGSVHTVKKKQLERFKYDDPHRIFLAVPGVYSRGEDGFGLRPNIGIRGGNSDRSKKVTLMEDGVLFGPAPYSAPAAYYFPIVARMRSIRVIKGPAAILYGPQTIGGAIDFFTEEVPASTFGSFDLAIGQFGYTKIHAKQAVVGDDVGILVEGVNLASSGFKNLDGGGDTGFIRREWMAKVAWLLPGSARVQHDFGVKLTWSQELSNETYLGLTDADFRATPYRRYFASKLDHMEWNRFSVVATHHARFEGGLDLTTSIYRHDFHRIWNKVNGIRGANITDVLAHPGAPANALFYGLLTGAHDSSSAAESIMIGPNDRTFVSQGIQTVARFTVKSGDDFESRLEYGARLHHDQIIRNHTQTGYAVAGGELRPDGRATELTADNTASTVALSFYAANAFVFWKRLTVTPGARFEIIRSRFVDRLGGRTAGGEGEASVVGPDSTGVAQVFLPGVGAHFGLTSNLGVIAGVYRGFSPPPPGSSSITRAEDSVNWEGGLRWSSKALRAEVLGFFNDYRNLTDVCTFSNGCIGASEDRQFDAGGVQIYGGEGYLESALSTSFGVTFPARVAYTMTQTRFLSSFSSADPQFGDVKEGDELPYVPKHQLSVTLGAETKKWGIAAQGMYVGRMREIAGSGALRDDQATDAYFLLDVSGTYRVTKWLSIYVNGRNLTDRAYLAGRRPFGARPGAPRWVQLGLRIEM